MSEHNDSGMNTDNETEPQGQAALVSRREALKAGGTLLGSLAAAPILGDQTFAAEDKSTQALRSTSLIHVASVSTIQDGGLLQALLLPFERQTGHHVQVHVGDDVYVQARAGKADVVLSHFGHKDAQAFVQEGLGQWPRTVLFNSIALIIPTNDPAHVAHLSDPVDVFRRIAASRSPFIINAIPELVYLADILWNAAGRPSKAGWYLDPGLKQAAAMHAASVRHAYTLWGVTPFLVAQRKARWALRPVVYGEEMFHRIMVSVVVNPAKFPHANVKGALVFQQYLLEPATQARILEFRYPGIAQPLFWPAGRNNAPYMLPPGSGRGGHKKHR